MPQYIGAKSTITQADHDQATAMAKRLLTMDYSCKPDSDFQRLASDLDEYLSINDIGRVHVNLDHGYAELDGAGPVFNEAKRLVLVDELGNEGIEKAIELAETVIRAYGAVLSSLGQHEAEFYAPEHVGWRVHHIMSLAKERQQQFDEPEARRL